MNGITNAQQQGGGGGGSAASYTKIESKIAKTAWTDNTPSWIGQNVLTWTLKGDFHYIQGGTEDLGLVEGGSYTTIVTIDGTDYEQMESSVMSDNDSGMISYLAYFNDYYVIMQIVDHCGGLDGNGRPVPGNGYLVMVMVEGTASSVIIKSCSAASGGKEAIINNSAIKTNSAVTMYVDYAGKMSALKKIDGSLTVSVSTMPSVDISYAIEIVDTNVEGLFEVINGYVPDIPSVSSNYDDLSNIPIINKENISGSDFTPVKNMYYRYTGKEHSEYTGTIYKCIDVGDTEESLELYELASMYNIREIAPVDKGISQTSTNVSITGSASPYLFTVTDSDIRSYKFVRLYPNDEATETWLNEHTLSSIIKEERGKFTFKVDTNTLPNTFSITYVIENFM